MVNSPRIEEHLAGAKTGKIMVDYEVVEDVVVWKDVLQEGPQGGNVPLSIADVINNLAEGLFFFDVKHLIEGLVRAPNPQVFVQYKHGLPDCVNGLLRLLQCPGNGDLSSA